MAFTKLSLRKRLFIAFLAVSFCSLIVGGVGLSSLSAVIRIAAEIEKTGAVFSNMLDKELAHLRWRQRLGEFQRNTETTVSVEKDPTRCSFGKWYYGEGRKEAEATMPSIIEPLRAIEQPHIRLHESAKTIEGFLQANQRDRARVYLGAEVAKHLGDVQRQLQEVRTLAEAQIERLHAQSARTIRARQLVSLSAVVLGVVLALFIGWLFARVMEQLICKITRRITAGADQVAGASEAIAAASEEISQAVTEQAAAVQETAASVAELSSIVGKNVESAHHSRDLSERGAGAAEEGKQVVGTMISSIDLIKEASVEAANRIGEGNQELSRIIQVIAEIEQKTNVINEIVFQTKLLSFNASVEAARAGEHGKGFAVVAEEVGNLARMSGKAAEEISTLLQDSIQKVQHIIENTRTRVETLTATTQKRVEEGREIAEKCGKVLDRLFQDVGEIQRVASDIAAASQEQSIGVGQIEQAMGQLDQATQQNASGVTQVASSAGALAKESGLLRQTVGELTQLVNGSNAQGKEGSKSAPVCAPSSSIAA